MATLDEDMRTIIAGCGLAYVATASRDAVPNLSPKGSLAVWDDEHLYFADIASPQTMRNLRENPRIEVNCVDIIKRRGYRFFGHAQIVKEGPVFDRAAADLLNTHGPQYPCKHAVLIAIESARPLLSPAYVFNEPPVTEEELSAAWARKLGLQITAPITPANRSGKRAGSRRS